MKPNRGQPYDPCNYGDIRKRMIRETSQFLSCALSGKIRPPRIPARKVSEGGYEVLKNHFFGKIMARRFWRSWFASETDPQHDAEDRADKRRSNQHTTE